MAIFTYSFLDTLATLQDAATGQFFPIGAGAGIAEEGITVEQVADIDDMFIGIDGIPVHSLVANKGAHVTVRVLKTSPVNFFLQNLLQLTRNSAATWGQITISVANGPLGDNITNQFCAFAKVPMITYAKDAGMNEWRFNVGICDVLLGNGG